MLLKDFQQHTEGAIGGVAHAPSSRRFEAIHELVAARLLEQVLGVTTKIEEVYSDAGKVEYSSSKSSSLTPKGDRLMRLQRALDAFQAYQLELAIREQDAKIFQMRSRH